MSGSTEHTLGRIEGKLDALQDNFADLKQEVRENRAETRELGEAIARAAEKFDPETGMLRDAYITCPYHRPAPPPAPTMPAEVEARTGFWRQAGKFFGALAALCGAAWAVVTGAAK